jgi:hypothetical protein
MAEESAPPDAPAEPAPARKRGRLVGLPRPAPTVSPAAIELAERLVRMARAGELVELAVVFVGPDGASGNDWTPIESAALVLGELRLLADDLSEIVRGE